MRVRSILILLIMLVFVPAVFLTFYGAQEERQTAARTAEQQARLFLLHPPVEFEHMVATTRQLLVALSRENSIIERDSDAASRVMQHQAAGIPYLDALGVADPKGIIYASALELPRGMNIAHRSFFQRALHSRQFSMGEFQVGMVERNAEIGYGFPVTNEAGRLVGVACATWKLGWLEQRFARSELPEGSVLIVVDGKGTLLARAPNGERWLGQNLADQPLVAEILMRQEGVIEARGLDGVERLFVFKPLGGPELAPHALIAVGVPLDVAYASAHAALTRNLLALLLVGGTAVLAAWYVITNAILRPVQALKQAFNRLGHGDLGARTGMIGTSSNELVRLCRDFDRMADDLQQGVEQRIELLAKEQAARAEVDTLKQLDRLRTDFANAVSHDLRGPLTMIMGYAELLEEASGDQLPPNQAAFLGRIRQGARRMSYLLNDFLDFARLEAGTFRLDPQPMDLRHTIREFADSFLPQLQDAGLELQLELPEAPLLVTYDDQRIGQVLTNLIGNAIKFTPQGGTIRVRAVRRAEAVCCEVEDTGPGIAPEDLGRLFQRFSQLERGRGRKGGMGLGLSISKALVEAHGGTIGVESVPGQGSTFWFTLPLEA